MSSDAPTSLMEAAAEVARLCGDVAMRYYRSGQLEVKQKENGSPVTNADLAAERAARNWIGQRFPSDGILGEEFGVDRPAARRRWVLDPIDGTRTFVRGVPLWGALVAVIEGDEILAGAACFPVTSELIWAAPGEGCWLNGGRAQVSQISRINDSLVLTTDPTFSYVPDRRERWQELEAAAAMSRSWGDCYGYLLVATGRAEAMVDPIMSEWDAAALLPIVEEAGGVFTDWNGKRTAKGGSGVATNAALAADVRRQLGASGVQS